MKAEIESPFRTFSEQPKKKSRIPRIPLRLVVALIGAGAIIYLIQGLRTTEIDPQVFSENLNLAKHKYEEGEALLELNQVRAREVLTESETQLNELMDKLKKGQKEYEKAASLLQNVQKALTVAQSAFSVQPNIFYELSLIRDGMTAEKMEGENENLYIFSRNKKIIAQLNVKTKKHTVIDGGDWLLSTKYFAFDTKHYIFLPDGISRGGKERKIVVEPNEEWGEIVDMVYFGGNLYLLDRKGAIHKYLPAGEDFVRRDYLKQAVDLSGAVSMAIDGNIWVMVNGKVYKFVNGRRDHFVVRGLEEPLGKDSYIKKTKNMDNLYIWSKQNKRIVVIDEEGNYRSQYTWKNIPEVKDFAVSESEDQLFLLTKEKIYTITL